MIDVEKYNKITYDIIGAAMEVHKELGFGFLENVYQKAMEQELGLRQILYVAQKPVEVFYKGKKIALYAPDLWVGDVIIELKALEVVDYQQIQSQVINYLVATKREVGLFINFGKTKLESKRFIVPEKFQRPQSA